MTVRTGRLLQHLRRPRLWLLAIYLSAGLVTGAAARDFDTGLVGNAAGRRFDVTCDAGSVLVGVHYGAGKDLEYVQPLCRPLNNGRLGGSVVGLQTVGDQTSDDSRVDNTLACPRQSSVIRMHVYLSRHGQVHAFGLTCFGVDLNNGQASETRQSATNGGAANSNADADCGANARAVGMIIGYGGLIGRLGLYCEPIAFPEPEPPPPPPPPPPPKKAPLPVDNAKPPLTVDNGSDDADQ